VSPSRTAAELGELESMSPTTEATPVVSIRNLSKTYAGSKGAGPAVDDVSLDIYDGEFFTLLGPSGCGKTTTLRSLAGLERPDSGEIVVGGRTLFSSAGKVSVAVNDRDVSMVFQSYAIWPHMTVFENVAFPLRARRRRQQLTRRVIEERVGRALGIVQLEQFSKRPATKLSGGQQQRLALARALVSQSPVMLLDEPLSNLDAKLRDAVRLELLKIQGEIGFTAIYVTHDQVEALALSSRIAVMSAGKVRQIGAPREIYDRPVDRFVADFIGRTNLLAAVVRSTAADECVLTVAGETLALPGLTAGSFQAGGNATLVVRPEHVDLAHRAADGPAGWNGVVETRQFLGESVEYVVLLADDSTRLHVRTDASADFASGDPIRVVPQVAHCRLLADTGRS